MGISRGIKRVALSFHGPFARKIALAHYYQSHDFEAEFESCVDDFVPKSRSADSGYLSSLRKEVKRNVDRYLIAPDEYFLYGFESLEDVEKRRFVGDIERAYLCARMYNNDAGQLFMDKFATYETFSKYFKRDVVCIKDEGDRPVFDSFVAKHQCFVIKPTRSSRGDGVKMVKLTGSDGEHEACFTSMLDNRSYVMEECIVQAQDMSVLHPESVNTVRYATYLGNDGVNVLASFLKIGRGSSVVDNGGAGGLLAAIDEETGIVTTPGRSEHGEVFEVHPDTGISIPGFAVPEWDKLRALAAELACVLPEQKYVGWDFAYSHKGWVLVEGNSGGQFVGPQISMQKGLRDLVDRTFGSL